MSYDFSKLSEVNINPTITENTYQLVVNGDNVERTLYATVQNQIKDYTSECTDYINNHSGSTPVDYIRGLSPLYVDTTYVPLQGFILYSGYYYLFTVYVNNNSPWYKITETVVGTQGTTEYLYSSSSLIEKVEKNSTDGTRFITDVAFDTISSMDISGDITVGGNLKVSGGSTLSTIKINTSGLRMAGSSISSSYSGSTPVISLDAYPDSSNVIIRGVEDPVNSNDAVNLSTLESSLNEKLSLDGGEMSGNIDMGENLITNISSPENDSDVANKKYVDEKIDELGQETTLQHSYIAHPDSINLSTYFSGNPADNVAIDITGGVGQLVITGWSQSDNKYRECWISFNINYQPDITVTGIVLPDGLTFEDGKYYILHLTRHKVLINSNTIWKTFAEVSVFTI